MKIAVSGCLLGENCKYNGGNNFNEKLAEFLKDHEVISICPEVLGGLPTPRNASEIVEGVVRHKDGTSVDAEFRKGAEVALKIVKENEAALVSLQSRSPSCGVDVIYDGTFSKTLIPGDGIFVQLLKENGIRALDVAELLKYYEAYEERYKTAHEHGVSWSSDKNTPIVMEMLQKYKITPEDAVLEIGCGEGRDAKTVLEAGYALKATDISREAINYCKKKMPEYREDFEVLDCLKEQMEEKFDFIYGVAVVHMLVLDKDRDGFYQFIYDHLKEDGVALICTMGDGECEMQSDISNAYVLQERNHESGKMMVAGTSCKMVSFQTFEEELSRNQLEVVEKGITSAIPDFNSLMYAIVKKKMLTIGTSCDKV